MKVRSAMTENRNAMLIKAVQQTLESLQSAGVRQLPKPPISMNHAPASPLQRAGTSVSAPPGTAELADEGQGPSATLTLELLLTEVATCTLCSELATARTQTVFGVGDSQARLCFLGEAPGADEDRLGEPFVGKAGQLLDKILAACNLTREQVYILNVLKCRPPGNRNPTGEEACNCRPFLERQLELIQPEFVCCLGAVAAQNFLDTDIPIGRLRGKVHSHQGRKVVCTYHPAYLLRNPSAKAATWDDMKLLMREMGTPVGGSNDE